MNEMEVVRIVEVVGDSLCVTPQDGQKVFETIRTAIEAGKSVAISFAGVADLTSAFLNAAIGQLYGLYPDQELKNRLSVRDASPSDLITLKRSVDRAKEYFQDRKRFEQAAIQELGEENE